MMNNDGEKPYILDETEDFAVVFKPARMHSAPLKNSGGDTGTGTTGCGTFGCGTLLDWYAALFPPIREIAGRKEGEGGLLHRLDFETQGLMLFAKNQHSMDYLLVLQEEGHFIKEYSAICHKYSPDNALFIHPAFKKLNAESILSYAFSLDGIVIESFFRPFGPGRKQVRPAMDTQGKNRKLAKDRGGYYKTEIVGLIERDYYEFTIRLIRGFRHQIRCHLAWIGCPVLNDLLYSKQPGDGFLALRAHGLIFTDPRNGKIREYRIEPLH